MPDTKIIAFTNPLKRIAKKANITKEKLLSSLLAGFSVPFILLISSTLSVYFSNSVELGFSFSDFVPTFALLSAVVFAVITLALLLTKGFLHNLTFALCSALSICAFVQSFITTMNFQGLPGDGNAPPAKQWWVISDLILWVAIFAAVICLCVVFSKSEKCRKIVKFLICLVMIMQSVSLMTSAVTFTSSTAKDSDSAQMYLTTNNMFEVSSNKNVIIFIVDRFDRNCYTELAENAPDALSEFDGFTCYDDNVSKYPRTYPSITYLLTGMENDFSTERSDYFADAYKNSSFLKDLSNNNYKINLFIPYYYTYTDASVFSDMVSNTSVKQGHSIRSNAKFTKDLLKLSSYFWLPDKFKSQTVYSNAFYESVEFEGTAPEYSMDKSSDSAIYAEFNNSGLSVQSEQNTFTFIHLRGCHPPYTTDENGTYKGDGRVTSLQQTQGVFNFISNYIKNLKDLGLYEDATIIVTGDHGALNSDSTEYQNPYLTALLVKESGQSGTPLTVSQAPVSQDNFLASIVKSAEIKTSTDYGKAFNEISEGDPVIRTHYFQKKNGAGNKDTNITYKINGSAKDFSNWKITNKKTNEYK